MNPSLAHYLESAAPPEPLEIPFKSMPIRPELRAVTVVPVAAHQEDVSRVIGAYTRQTTSDGWRPHLFLNAPESERDNPQVERNIAILNDLNLSEDDRPEINWALKFYGRDGSDDMISMGKVRRDAWLQVLGTVASSHAAEDIIGFSHDADMLRLSPDYFKNSLAVADNQAAHLLTSDVYWGIDEHDAGDNAVPALNRLAAYMGISEQALKSATNVAAVWDMAIGFRLGSYALAGGYQDASAHTETAPIIEALRERVPQAELFAHSGEFVVTSMRRYLLRAAAGESPFSHTDPQIGTHDKARGALPPIKQAEQQTRANFAAWCDEADDNNIRSIRRRFSEADGANIELRVDFYEQLVNCGRELMRQAGNRLNDSPGAALPVSIALAKAVKRQANVLSSKTDL